MATYKVIQDIEAEDKLIGWMTPRQTIYAAIVVVSGFIGFMLSNNGAWWLAIFLLPHMILFTVLAGPFVHDQPSETWLLAKIRFALVPRRRVWDQTGIKELVTITVPKKIERRLTDGLSQTEVRSRLSALANTLDSRGWAVKNITTNLYVQPAYETAYDDRLVSSSSLPQEVQETGVSLQDDILDERNNPTAQHLDQMIQQSAQAHKQQIIQQMTQPVATQAANPWFMNATAGHQMTPVQPQAVGPSSDDQAALLNKVHKQAEEHRTAKSHLRTVKTPHEIEEEKRQQAAQPKQPEPSVTAQHFATNNDLNVATIARQANKNQQQLDDGEVIISLH